MEYSLPAENVARELDESWYGWITDTNFRLSGCSSICLFLRNQRVANHSAKKTYAMGSEGLSSSRISLEVAPLARKYFPRITIFSHRTLYYIYAKCSNSLKNLYAFKLIHLKQLFFYSLQWGCAQNEKHFIYFA